MGAHLSINLTDTTQMTKRKYSPAHDFWHPRIEGQIKHTIGQHPDWFNFKNKNQKQDCINSLAKRIVGQVLADINEFVAAAKVATDTEENASKV